jgi:Arc/MetJ-type ribon-helix-helix transcriptional regulator
MVSVRLDADLVSAMDALQEKHGTPYSEQVRRALRPWLETQGVLKKGKPSTGEKTSKKP